MKHRTTLTLAAVAVTTTFIVACVQEAEGLPTQKGGMDWEIGGLIVVVSFLLMLLAMLLMFFLITFTCERLGQNNNENDNECSVENGIMKGKEMKGNCCLNTVQYPVLPYYPIPILLTGNPLEYTNESAIEGYPTGVPGIQTNVHETPADISIGIGDGMVGGTSTIPNNALSVERDIPHQRQAPMSKHFEIHKPSAATPFLNNKHMLNVGG